MAPLHSIKKLIATGEGSKLDFKQTISDAPKIAKTLVAFANNKGGTLLIGVRDNGSLAGIRSEDEKYMLELAGHLYCKPSIDVNFKEHEIEGKTIIEATIPEGFQKPYYAKDTEGKWWVYNRVSDKSLLASAVMFQVIKRKNGNANTVLKYSFLENQILSYLKLSPNATLHELVHALNVKKHRIVHSLGKLIYFELIAVGFMNKQETYSLSH
ncbi:MAG: ATP-binding protein [bacterium]|nr:ATP-binding protein [bacterium]